MRRRAPRRIAELIEPMTAALEPASTLAAVQRCWERVVGERIADCAQPVGERDGVLQLACEDAVWAAELDLMGPSLVGSLNEAIGAEVLTRVRVGPGAVRARQRRP
jgi:predicted nucleic acid-binding Zn ribbon protein